MRTVRSMRTLRADGSIIQVFLHCSFDNYKPHLLQEEKEDGKIYFSSNLMIPPGSLNYFYAISDANDVNKDTKKRNIKTLTDTNNPTFYTDMMTVQIEHAEVSVPKVNYLDSDVDIFQRVISPVELVDWKAVPRPPSRHYDYDEAIDEEFFDEDDEEKKR